MPTKKKSLTVSIEPDLEAWVREEADARMVSPAVLVEKGLGLLRDVLVPVDQALAIKADVEAARVPGRPVTDSPQA